MFVAPPPLTPGSVVAVVAPSSPFAPLPVWRGLAALRRRYRLRFSRRIFDRNGYLAGSDAARRAELERALLDPEVSAILATRGGYGATRLVSALPWDALAARPRWIVGFSDITALHIEAQRVGVMSLHASHVNALDGPFGQAATEEWFRRLEAPLTPRRYEGLTVVAHGEASGPVVGGNLALLHAMAAAGRLALPDGALLFLEDIGERPYRIDRMLQSLLSGGHLDRVAGVLLGDFTDCEPGPDRVRVLDVLAELLAPRNVPVVAGLPMGHDRRNDPLVLGLTGAIDTSRASVSFGAPGPGADAGSQ